MIFLWDNLLWGDFLWDDSPVGWFFCGMIFLWDDFPLQWFSCGMIFPWDDFPVGWFSCGLIFLWDDFPVGWFSCGMWHESCCAIKNIRLSMHVFRCLVEMIGRVLSPRTTFWKPLSPWNEWALELFGCSKIDCFLEHFSFWWHFNHWVFCPHVISFLSFLSPPCSQQVRTE